MPRQHADQALIRDAVSRRCPSILLRHRPRFGGAEISGADRRVVDDANILSSGTKADLTQKLAALEAKTSRQLVIVTLRRCRAMRFGLWLSAGPPLGHRPETLNNGILSSSRPGAQDPHRGRYGLEPIVTDAFSSW